MCVSRSCPYNAPSLAYNVCLTFKHNRAHCSTLKKHNMFPQYRPHLPTIFSNETSCAQVARALLVSTKVLYILDLDAAMAQKRQMMFDSSSSAKCKRFLSPREYLGRFQGLIQHGPGKPSALALARAKTRARFEMALSAAAIREANSHLQDPIRIRYDMEVDDGDAMRPCAQCSLHVDTAFVKARDRCTVCEQHFCHTCLRRHAAVCHPIGATYTREDSTTAEDDSDLGSDISVE